MKTLKCISAFVLVSLAFLFLASPTMAQEEVFMVVEVMPVFPGGEEALHKYLAENLNYPQAAKESGISGKVYVSFIIEVDGSVSDVNILRDIGGGCGEEAARVVRNMPRWEPGTHRSKPVRVRFSMPVNFILEDGKAPQKKK